jgi:hypothetical protein
MTLLTLIGTMAADPRAGATAQSAIAEVMRTISRA